MEILILVVVAVTIGAWIYINRNKTTIDTNKDGKISADEVKAEVKAVAKKTVAKAKAAAPKKTAKK